jgi:hypothetical protein
MALAGISLSLDSIPGLSSLLGKLDSLKADFLAVPAAVNAALDRLALVRQAMVANSAPPSAQSDALGVEQHLRQVLSEWSVAATSLQNLDAARRAGSLSLDTVINAGHLLTSFTYVRNNTKTLMSSVDALASRYLTPAQVASLNKPRMAAGLGLGTLALVGAVAWLVGSRRG